VADVETVDWRYVPSIWFLDCSPLKIVRWQDFCIALRLHDLYP
jgi:hypothetical protein